MNPLDATSVISTAGLLGIFLVLVAETGLLVGFFLPGDSLLFTAGLLAASSGPLHLPLGWVLAVSAAGALVGAQLGYYLGRSAGTRLVDRSERPALRRATKRVEVYLSRYGVPKAVVMARFIPVVRTVINPLIGMIGVPVRRFTLWQVIGGLAWTVGIVVAGFLLGSRIPNIDHYLLPVIALVVALSLVPIALEVVRSRRHRSDAPPAPAPAIDVTTGR